MRHRPIPILRIFIGALVVSAAAGVASANAAAAKRCADPSRRQFDFWVGVWDVTTPDGSVAGSNTIEKASEGCALVERWSGARGGRGTSLNFYESATRQWVQIWVDNDGEVLRLSGGLQQGCMVLSGALSSNGAARQRITWTPLGTGRVRQLWESSADGGRTWKTEFDGTYTRRGSPKLI